MRKLYTIVVSLLLLVAACQPTTQSLRIAAIPWADGETSSYRITDIEGNFAGNATIALTAGAATVEGDGWTMRREILAQGDQEVVVVEMRSPSLRPSLSTLVRLIGQGRQQVKATYSSGQVDMELTTAQDVTTYERVNIPSDARDQRTLIQLVRALPLTDDYATQVNSFLPVANLLERVTVVVIGREAVTVPTGSYESWHVELRTSDSTSQLWVGVEAPYLLLKFIDDRSGATYELQEYTAAQ